MKNRRSFIKSSILGSAALVTLGACQDTNNNNTKTERKDTPAKGDKPIVISTWDHGVQSNEVSWEILSKGGSALDAVELGVRKIESDPNGHTVGIGGAPDRDGIVSLDACIMNHKSECGAVAFLQNIENPISVARKVMEVTPHVMLAGQGAYQFARAQGFPHKDLLTAESEKRWKEWLEKSRYEPEINKENHDTIGALALDNNGNLAGACTTSGMAYKMHGRVGDSPIIGAGLFVDNEVGAACATGVGEAIVRVAGSAIVVELMRYGKTPKEACKEAVRRIIEKHPSIDNLQVGFIALDKNGNYGAHSVYEEFTYAVQTKELNKLFDSPYEVKL